MSNFGLTRRISALVAAFVIVSIAAVAGLSYAFETSSSELRNLLTQSSRVSQTLFALIEAVGKVQGISQKVVREKDPDVMEKLIAEQKSLVSSAETGIGEARAHNADVSSEYHALVRANGQAAETVLRGEYANAQQMLIEQSDPAFEALLKGIVKAQQEARRATGEETARAVERNSSARLTIYLAMAGVLIALAVFAGLALRAISAGLRSTVRELCATADQMTSSAAQVSAAAQTLSQGASKQASAVESAAASSGEISSMTSTNAGNSLAAARLAQKAAEAVEEANQRLKQMQLSMQDMRESSGKVSKIIQVIDGIAFQTNILALNAAVEAARAGEAGLGFAVVADEVRSLAQRCSQAAKDTSELIEQSISKSNEGSLRLDEMAVAMASITGGTEQVRGLVAGVSGASQEQAQRFQGLVRSVSEIRQGTENAAASAEQSAAAGEQLSAEAIALRAIVQELSVLVDGAYAVTA